MKKELLVKLVIILIVLVTALFLTFKVPVKLGLDLKGGVAVTLQAESSKDAVVNNQTMQSLMNVIERRVNGLGVSESTIERNGNDKIIVQLPGVKDRNEAIDTLGKMANLEFRLVNVDGSLGKVLLTGKDVKGSALAFDQGMPSIALTFSSSGAKKFAEVTSENIGRQLAIQLDGKTQSAPTIQVPILNGQASITGKFTVTEAQGLVNMLNAGALPLKTKIVQMQEVGPTLGQISIVKSFHAGILALVLIGIFMFVWYRVPGIVAIISLLIFGVITFGGMQFFGVTFTLAGIAAFILTLGIAVDANVIIFERIKEEMRLGNSVLKSVEIGTKKTMVTIIDAHMTGIIISLILIWLGTGTVKGFAVTLIIGLVASLFTNVWASNVLLREFVMLFKIKNVKLFGVKPKGDK